MQPVPLLKELGLLEGCNTALDIGTRDGATAAALAREGLQVTAIDIRELPEAVPGICFEKIGIEEFLQRNTKKYDVVVMRHVLHLVADPKAVIRQLQSISRVLFFTCFGPKDEWAGEVSTLSHEELLGMFIPETVKHHSEVLERGKTYAGDEKLWHINTFVIVNG